MNKFKKMPVREEKAMLISDWPKFKRTKKYLVPLIEAALGRFSVSSGKKELLSRKILGDLPIAAHRYLNDKKSGRGYGFAAYFTWYIARRIDEDGELKKKRG
jgi:hypothetical protein